ncbi:squamosa promoter-binding-like protein 14 isoform X2 [Magnolia sinica]|uniref:squamosa promoter-binding-like protein 14 isoform X2 n=1 Tax=Magnolia sinica TaxID=86752 RepID=UPI00265AE6BE|nr:squamosa promoter-binding-like protein 14 isoform X2 [Magnolia sinica]
MEGEVGAQVAPTFIHEALPGRFCERPPVTRKRDLQWQNDNFQQQLRLNSGFQNQSSKNHWDPKVWDWDSVAFVGEPVREVAEGLRLGPAEVVDVDAEENRKGEGTLMPLALRKGSADENGENLTLKLGGSTYFSSEVPVLRPNKRVCSGSPGGTGSYPMCQVDDCRADLSSSKDYHRRHKVCEHHSKTAKALVGQQLQRFCQQCSRFHLLSEFDEGKRSCRRRLAGHNRRRRKTQPEDVSSRLLVPGNQERNGSGELDIINLLTVIARLQGNNVDKTTNGPSIADADRVIQILSKIISLPMSTGSAKLPVLGGFDLNISQTSQASSEQPSSMNRNQPASSNVDLLAVLSAALAACSPNVLAILSQGSSDISSYDKTKANSLEQDAGFNLQKKESSVFPSVGMERSNSSYRSPLELSECLVQDAQPSLSLQLFSSSPEDGSSPNLGSSRKYFSSDSSNPMEERSPPSSPPLVQKLFPLHSAKEIMKHERMSVCREDNVAIEASTSNDWSSALELFKGSNGMVGNNGVSVVPFQAGYTSSSGSDYSPSSSNSDAQDRTGRIIFKLFDKDPSSFPGTLRAQILSWLSNSPSEMESYIRPGCVVLSVYVSMPSIAWEELQEDLIRCVSTLLQGSDLDFWRTGRFLVHTDRQLASHKDGKIRLCKSWRTWSAPELVSVSPLAFEAGKETSLILRGRNLNVPGTKIHCTYRGGYVSKEVSGSYSGTIYDDSSVENFSFPGGAPNVLGRCFIEVENGFKGNSFPVILADAAICRELRILESEFEEDARRTDVTLEDPIRDFGRPRSREDLLHFLNELGWLFQRKGTSASSAFSPARFKLLFAFSVERDWSAVVKTLLDLFIEGNSGRDGLSGESLEALSEIQLLNRAVKRKCREMVELLLHYFVSGSNNASKKYLFPPNVAGPGGVTPLHLAACTQDSEDMVDALTNDPQEVGLKCWSSLLDVSGHSPHAYALMRNNHSYNRVVARKVADRRNRQVSIPITNADISLEQSWMMVDADKLNPQGTRGRACAQCAVAATRKSKLVPSVQGLLHRPYARAMLAIAAVCVCVCLFLRGSPDIGSIAPFKWENVDYGMI